jgi:hypothetical protein
MDPRNPFSALPIREILQTLLPDFVLAFAFFTALVYAILGKRFDHQRPAVAMSVAMGIALAVGLVWWEQSTGVSIRDLGPIAVGFAIIMLGITMYQAVRHAGGSWAGVGIALGACFLVSQMLVTRWPLDPRVIQTATTVALVVGILAFLMHHSSQGPTLVPRRVEIPIVKHDRTDLQQGYLVSDLLDRRFRELERKADHLHEHPADAEDAMLQLRRMLPAEGWLTQRLADLRQKAYRMREGHVARIQEIATLTEKLPPPAKKKLSDELRTRYKELGLDLRLDRLDRAATANETKIRELTRLAQECTAAHDYRKLHDALKAAEKLQKHNSSLFQIIDRTEKRLLSAARKAAEEAGRAAGG